MLREVPITIVMRNAQLDRHNAEQLERIARETVDVAPEIIARTTAAGDTRKIRGLPAFARGVGGAIVGTVPGQKYN